MECHYYKLEPNYWFYMMIKANENGKRGVYEVKVEIGFEDGLATLCKFDFLRFDGMLLPVEFWNIYKNGTGQ